MIAGRTLAKPGRSPGAVLRGQGVAVREAFHGPWRVWAFNGVLAVACWLVWKLAIAAFGNPRYVHGPHLAWWALALAFYFVRPLTGDDRRIV